MQTKGFWKKIDQFICHYLAINQEEDRPGLVQRIGNNIIVTYTSSFKRHAMTQPLEEFVQQKTNTVDMEKLGLAAGKAIAKKLVISFQETTMKEP